MTDKAEELKKLKKELEEDEGLPLRDGATQLVFGEGDPDSEIYFLGEAPGFNEDRLGRPFVGQAGKLLDQLVEGIGLKREQVYISNVVRFRPPGNRDPLPEEIEAFRPYVDREIKIVAPKIVVTLGRFSMGKFFPNAKISQIHGKQRVVNWNGKNITVMPMYHPAAALRSIDIMRQIREDFRVIPEMLKKIKNKEEKGEGEKNNGEQMSLV